MRWLKYALLNVLRNRRRSLVTALIATVGTAGVLISGGFGLYTYDSLAEYSARDSGHLTLAHPDYFEREEETPLALGLSDWQPLAEQWTKDRRVRAALPRVALSGLISNGDKSVIFMGQGVQAREFTVKGPFLNMVAGKPLSHSAPADAEPQIMLAVDLARGLKAQPGDSLTLLSTTSEGALNGLDVQVRGVFSTGVPELDKRMLYVRLGTAQSLLDSDRVSTLSVYLRDTEQTDAMQSELESALTGQNLKVTPWWARAFFYEKVVALYDRIFGIMGVVIAALVFFSVSNTMTMSVVERTREIGTLAALGTTPREVLRNFLLEALIIGAAGVLLGVLIALATSGLLFVVDVQMPPPPGRSESYPLHVYFSPTLAAYTAAAVLAVCTGAAWSAARRGVKTPIVEALTHV